MKEGLITFNFWEMAITRTENAKKILCNCDEAWICREVMTPRTMFVIL